MKKYTIAYKLAESIEDEIVFYEDLGPYQLWVKLSIVASRFEFGPISEEDFFFVEYDGYVWDCTNHDRLRQVKRRLIKELQV